MLAIRLQRTGRKGLAQYRMVVQDADRTPTSGRVVAHLGHYNPHTKEVVIKKDKVEYYLKNGAQPSERAVGLLMQQGVIMPAWVKQSVKQTKSIKHPEKLRKNQPKEELKEEVAQEEPTEAPKAETIEPAKVEEPTAEAEQQEEPKEA